MKSRVFTLLAVLFLFAGLERTNAQNIDTNVVRIRTADIENGTGLAVGFSDRSLFVLTANHVIEGQGDEDVSIYFHSLPDLRFLARIAAQSETRGHDLALLDIDLNRRENAANLPFLQLENAPKTIVSRSRLQKCDLDRTATVVGHASGHFNQQLISTRLQSLRYDNQSDYFTLGLSSIESGISGSPVFNAPGEWIGLVSKVEGDEKSSKAIALKTVLAFLEQHQVPLNMLRLAPFVGQWTLESVIVADRPPVAIPGNRHLQLNESGRSTGIVPGRYCLADKDRIEFVIRGMAVGMSIPDADGNTSTIMRINPADACTINTSAGFDFGGASEPGNDADVTRLSAAQDQFDWLVLSCIHGDEKRVFRFAKGQMAMFATPAAFGQETVEYYLEEEAGFGLVGGDGYAMAYEVLSAGQCQLSIRETNSINVRSTNQSFVGRYDLDLRRLDPRLRTMFGPNGTLILFASKGKDGIRYTPEGREINDQERQNRTGQIGFHFEEQESAVRFGKLLRDAIEACS